ncbi:protein phosphatase 2C domain-containing protein [Thioalkalivibrio sp. XN8]|uniref:protein phosphatase 2C domain-containing protein n=1 Tax=Thioalkalivibrio sp. XN8 TaxID=2712863 RepID=UPI0013EC73DF|nr:SpoIIE family protein phosphatase [Thioalkalivibrio sp. XN8]
MTAAIAETSFRLAEAEDTVEQLLRAADGAAVAWARPCAGKERGEDALLVLSLDAQHAVLAVADGMGGLPGGGAAAAGAIDTLAAVVEREYAAGQALQAAILDGIAQANAAVLAQANGSATTLVVAELCAGRIRAYNVGDSEVIVLGQRGRLKLRTLSHSPVGFAVQAGLVNQEEALHHEDRHLVSNFLGSHDMRIEVSSAVRLAPQDTVLACSDGLVDNLRLEEITALLRCGPLDRQVRRLAQSAVARMEGAPEEAPGAHPSKPDDLTLVAFRRRPGKAVEGRLPPPRQLTLEPENT